MVTWLESIKSEVDGGLLIQWKTHSLEQPKGDEGRDFKIWENPENETRGLLALVASKAAQNQGDALFLAFHLATFHARHRENKEISDFELLKGIARDAGLDAARFEKDMANLQTWQAVGKDHEESVETYNVFGVPTIVFAGSAALFVKLDSIPEARDERVELFERVADLALRKSYVMELKRP